MVYLLNMVIFILIFHSYVSLPEGINDPDCVQLPDLFRGCVATGVAPKFVSKHCRYDPTIAYGFGISGDGWDHFCWDEHSVPGF